MGTRYVMVGEEDDSPSGPAGESTSTEDEICISIAAAVIIVVVIFLAAVILHC